MRGDALSSRVFDLFRMTFGSGGFGNTNPAPQAGGMFSNNAGGVSATGFGVSGAQTTPQKTGMNLELVL